jgi:hypothetical protein
MNFLFLRQPPDDTPHIPHALAAESKSFTSRNLTASEDELRAAQAHLHSAMEKHTDGSFDSERALAAAEENLDAVEARMAHAKAKRRWELDEKWQTLFPPHCCRYRAYPRSHAPN